MISPWRSEGIAVVKRVLRRDCETIGISHIRISPHLTTLLLRATHSNEYYVTVSDGSSGIGWHGPRRNVRELG